VWLHLFLVKIHSLEPSPAFEHCLWENLCQLTLPVSEPSTVLTLGNDGTVLQVDQLMRHNPEIWIHVLIWHNSYTFQQNTKVKMHGNTVLFPCGVRRVASCLLSKLVGLYRRVIYMGDPLKGPRSTMIGWHTNIHAIQCSFFNFIYYAMSFTKLNYKF
jgi:hypothetical protein